VTGGPSNTPSVFELHPDRGPLEAPHLPSLRERLARRPLGIGLWAGLILLTLYFVVAVGALVEFRSSLGVMPTNIFWIEPEQPVSPMGPSWTHPLGVLPGIGTDMFRAIWQATPWDLAIVASILAFDAVLGWLLGALAGISEGGFLDAAITFLGDTVGAIPSFFLVVALFAGIGTVYPHGLTLFTFVLLFGAIIWPTTARTTRERARLVAREPFLESAKASGADNRYLYFRHVLPNSISPLLAQIPIDVAPIFFVLTVFPWFWDCASLGAYNQSHIHPAYLLPSLPYFSPLPSLAFPEWGNLLAVGVCEGLPISGVGGVYWWMFVPTLVAIVGLGIGVALVCDGIDRRITVRYR
jgi:ABC-type dipeptide/oligopeptide/nickel transport system permease subunit